MTHNLRKDSVWSTLEYWFCLILLENVNFFSLFLSGLKGPEDKFTSTNNKKPIRLTDMFDVFKKVKGTPKFWQAARNDLVAKVKQLGPFHIFYTFSCGEMRWSEVFLTLPCLNVFSPVCITL